MAAGDLTTLSDVKNYLRLGSETQYDTFLSNLIPQVSRRIEKDCQRTFAAADYVEFWNTSTRQQRVQVRNKPIIQVNSVRWGVFSALQISYSGNAVSASVQITPDRRCVLRTISTSGVSDSTINLTTSSYVTCSQLATGISAVSGFSASLLGGVDVPTRWLNPVAGITLKGSNTSYTQQINWPGIESFTYYVDSNAGTIAFGPLTSLDYFFQEHSDASTPITFPGMYQGLCIDYRGGYEANNMPGDVNLLAQEIVAEVFHASAHNGNLQSESLLDYSYSQIDPILRRQMYADRLSPYRRVPLAGGMG
jgi:hypothetical protein